MSNKYNFKIMDWNKNGYKNDKVFIQYDAQFWLDYANGEVYSFTSQPPLRMNCNYIFNSKFYTL